MVSPKKWFLFPQNNTYEVKWSYYINNLFGYVVQSKTVKEYLLNRSNKINDVEKKYIVSNGCLLLNYYHSVAEWNDRKIDILIYSKFADLNKEKELQQLLSILKMNYTIINIHYGNHTKSSLVHFANKSKILIYYSFYDCWPSSLMEMQNMGIFPVVQQYEFIDKYGVYINDFIINSYYLVNTVNKILSIKQNSTSIANYYRKRNSCLNILNCTLFTIYNRHYYIK